MRHLKRTAKLGRTGQHRNRMLASLVCSLIKHRRVITTLAKAKAARSVAEKMITLGKGGTLHDRRLASARLHQDETAIKILFNDIAPTQKERRGGYTRIVRLGQRQGDAAQQAILEFVDVPVPEAPAQTAQAGTTEAKEPEKAEKKEEKKEEQAAAAPA
ncbi:MAG TPA: 50S ribosomal protein L17 [Candidatus Cybelea sp.]|jgi:large subunit ribosomal protein L17|nr:50S ribosomal protein L17 [Candidatus Cybelea sp.]